MSPDLTRKVLTSDEARSDQNNGIFLRATAFCGDINMVSTGRLDSTYFFGIYNIYDISGSSISTCSCAYAYSYVL
ncbi:hypothetical protein MPLSOD_330036 [Mesorhizobium sp. SOD10]|nr:hypothetical protein MPLSOD_330036 [Mesorhizobium sp. SOD10]